MSKTITAKNLMKFDEWLLYNPDVTTEDMHIILEFVGDYIKGDK